MGHCSASVVFAPSFLYRGGPCHLLPHNRIPRKYQLDSSSELFDEDLKGNKILIEHTGSSTTLHTLGTALLVRQADPANVSKLDHCRTFSSQHHSSPCLCRNFSIPSQTEPHWRRSQSGSNFSNIMVLRNGISHRRDEGRHAGRRLSWCDIDNCRSNKQPHMIEAGKSSICNVHTLDVPRFDRQQIRNWHDDKTPQMRAGRLGRRSADECRSFAMVESHSSLGSQFSDSLSQTAPAICQQQIMLRNTPGRDHSRRRSLTAAGSPSRAVASGSPAVGVATTHEQLLQACMKLNEPRLLQLLRRVRLMGSRPATVNQIDTTGRTPLSYLCSHSSPRSIAAFSQLKNVRVNHPDNDRNTPLHFAAQSGNTDVVKAMLASFPDIEVDAQNIHGLSPLHKACIQGRTDIAKLLIEHGASMDLRDISRGLTAIEWAELCGRQECVEALNTLQLAKNSPKNNNKFLRCNPLRCFHLGSRCRSAPEIDTVNYRDYDGIFEQMKILLHQCVKPPNVKRSNSTNGLNKRLNRRVMSRCQSEGVLNTAPVKEYPCSTPNNRNKMDWSFTEHIPDIFIQHVNAKDDPIATRYGDPVSPFQQRKCGEGQNTHASLLRIEEYCP